jgi:aldehyde:ferredoxin oxidoreductase
MYGWRGQILRIDFSRRTWTGERPDSGVLQKFVGGRGLAGHYLRDHVARNWDDPDLPLLFFAGPLVDTPSPTSGRMSVMSRLPLTGTIGDASVGGSLDTAMKRAGWDYITK